MRWLRYSADGGTRYGIVEGDRIREVEGTPFGDSRTTGRVVALADVTIEVPVIPPTFYCCGMNYRAHLAEAGARTAEEPKRPEIGYRANSALIAHGQPIIIPEDATEAIQYEGELVVVIGRRAKGLAEAEALDCVFGYTIGNDVSERNWQKSDRTIWRSKNSDTFKPMGPWIETDVDLDSLETLVRVNGRETTRFRTNDMIFGVAAFISAITRYITLVPGDIIWMGTSGKSPNLLAGDEVEVEISGIGLLRNKLVRAEKLDAGTGRTDSK